MNKNAVLILHGFFEHKGRHEINAKWFQKLNIDSHLIVLPGHGEFVEKRGSIDSWDEMDKSLKDGFKKIENYDNKIIFGHSIGALVAVHGILNNVINPDYLILTAPTFQVNYPEFLKKLAKPLSSLAPNLRSFSNVTKNNLTNDKDVVKNYFNDPLVFRSITFRAGYEIIKAQDYVNSNIKNLNIETLVLHGENDTISPIQGSLELSKLENVKYIKVENSKHEILNQDTRMYALSEIHEWLKIKGLV